MDSRFDICIIGAGPAGSTFARLIGKAGYSVLLLDPQKEEKSKPCGGLLAPDAQKALAGFDLTLPKSVLVDPQIFSVKTMDLDSGLTRYYPRCYLNVNRFLFDQWLVSLCPGSVKILKERAQYVKKQGNLFEITTSSSTYTSTYLVGADGAKSLVRSTFFKDRPKVKEYLAIQQWFPIEKNVNPFYSCIFDSKASPSCSWSICKDEAFIFGGCFEIPDARKQFELQKSRLEKQMDFHFSTPFKTEACLALRPRKLSDFVTGKGNLFLIGEAAGFISPSSFEGISSAIISGKMLAQAFEKGKDIQKTYDRMALPLKIKLFLKNFKHFGMYTPWTRKLLMRSGITTIKVKE